MTSDTPHRPAVPSTGELDLDDRAALRRVAGLSTELADVSEVEYRQLRLERVVLVGVWTEGAAADADASLAELAALAETAGSEVLDGLIQRRDKPDPATYIGAGKAAELREVVLATGADTVICDGELSPAQLTALEKAVRVKVIDRTALILDIFAQHATSREGKAQVALAQMEYMLPRLRGWGESMSRQAGGRAGALGEHVAQHRPHRLDLRERAGVGAVEHVHQQVGVGDLLQGGAERLDQLGGQVADEPDGVGDDERALFGLGVEVAAPGGRVQGGEQRVLHQHPGPGQRVEQARLAGVGVADDRDRGHVAVDAAAALGVADLLHRLDVAAQFGHPLADAAPVGFDLGLPRTAQAHPAAAAAGPPVPELLVVNKIDAADELALTQLRRALPEAVFVSARTGAGLTELRETMSRLVERHDTAVDVTIPYHRGDLVARLHEEGRVHSTDHDEGGTRIRAQVPAALAAALAEFASPPS
ncbi:hypothetical protein A5643_01760 [Mycobacterium sp. 1274756.6]|nr:hypothetical protein A5643_01760 [Mycobacterium sp. 1274756.6]